MIKAFVINLDSDTERMRFMAEQLDARDISYERFSAIYPEEVLVDEYDVSRACAEGGHELLPGELGCAVSHKRIYEKILQQNLEYALILEDDVELPIDFESIIELECSRNKGKWDYLLFDYWQPGIPFIRRWFNSILVSSRRQQGPLRVFRFFVYSFLKGLYILPVSLFEGFRNRYKAYTPGPVTFYRPLYLAGAYLVTREGVQKLLSLARPVIYTADKLPNQARIKAGLRFFAYAPCSVRQRKEEFGSSILGFPGEKIDTP